MKKRIITYWVTTGFVAVILAASGALAALSYASFHEGTRASRLSSLLLESAWGWQTYARRTGQVRTGMDADLVLLESDPARDVNALAHVALTIRKGQIIYQKP